MQTEYSRNYNNHFKDNNLTAILKPVLASLVLIRCYWLLSKIYAVRGQFDTLTRPPRGSIWKVPIFEKAANHSNSSTHVSVKSHISLLAVVQLLRAQINLKRFKFIRIFIIILSIHSEKFEKVGTWIIWLWIMNKFDDDDKDWFISM